MNLEQISLFGTIIQANRKIQNISTSETISDLENDIRVIASTDNINITLGYSNNIDGVVADVFAVNTCNIIYYRTSSSATTLNMGANTSARFVYHNGWNYCGIYNAIWN